LEYAAQKGAELIIVTGGLKIPERILKRAKAQHVGVLRTPYDTLKTARLIASCAPVSDIMVTDNLTGFYEHDDVAEAREVLSSSRHTTFPVMDPSGRYVGFLSRRHLLKPNKHLVILVDHNEYAQSVGGLKEAEILAIIDHHKLGDVVTNRPLTFVCRPVGSTCTLVAGLIREATLMPTPAIAGILLSGILSDTLYFQSPTTVEEDREMTEWLLGCFDQPFDTDTYAKALLKAGTSLEGMTAESIFYKDFKIFRDAETSIGVSQIFTFGQEEVETRREEILELLNRAHLEQGFDATLFMATDLSRQGSYLYFTSRLTDLIQKCFEVPSVQGVFVAELLSRKKQVIPRLLEEISVSRRL
jgi:manganese-dependent inorganic pyrophosphatase